MHMMLEQGNDQPGAGNIYQGTRLGGSIFSLSALGLVIQYVAVSIRIYYLENRLLEQQKHIFSPASLLAFSLCS